MTTNPRAMDVATARAQEHHCAGASRNVQLGREFIARLEQLAKELPATSRVQGTGLCLVRAAPVVQVLRRRSNREYMRRRARRDPRRTNSLAYPDFRSPHEVTAHRRRRDALVNGPRKSVETKVARRRKTRFAERPDGLLHSLAQFSQPGIFPLDKCRLSKRFATYALAFPASPSARSRTRDGCAACTQETWLWLQPPGARATGRARATRAGLLGVDHEVELARRASASRRCVSKCMARAPPASIGA
jgi:hypothetical protein